MPVCPIDAIEAEPFFTLDHAQTVKRHWKKEDKMHLITILASSMIWPSTFLDPIHRPNSILED
jgi:hypothetical protein